MLKMSDGEVAGRRAYEIFRGHYSRIYATELPTYEQLGSSSAQVWNATAIDLKAETPSDPSAPERA